MLLLGKGTYCCLPVASRQRTPSWKAIKHCFESLPISFVIRTAMQAGHRLGLLQLLCSQLLLQQRMLTHLLYTVSLCSSFQRPISLSG
jgi:hypothetical protein